MNKKINVVTPAMMLEAQLHGLDEATNGRKPMFYTEVELSGLMYAYNLARPFLTQAEHDAFLQRVLPAIDWKNVQSELDLPDTISTFVRVISGEKLQML